MRLSIIAGLLLSPSLLHAQTGSQSTALQARLATPTALVASAAPAAPAAGANVSTRTVRVSTGVIPAKLVATAPLAYRPFTLGIAAAEQAEMKVQLTVNEKGQPENIHVVKPVDAILDAAVVEAVRHYQFKPAVLDSEPVASDFVVDVKFER